MTQRFRNWAFTDFELIDWESVFKADDNIRYVCFGEEKCPESGRTHYQGWLQLEKPRRLSTLKKQTNKTIHFEGCRGTEFDNEKYCTKDGSYQSFGQFKTQGFRTDLTGIFEQIESGAPLYDVAKANPQLFCQYRNGINQFKSMSDDKTCPAWRDVEVVVICGSTGTGKTREAMKEATFKINGSELQWWDGYDNDEVICIDEYDTDVSITKILNILDGYKLRLPIKGGFTYAKWKKVYITSNVRLNDWHSQAKQEHRNALYRRITHYELWERNSKLDLTENLHDQG